MSDAVINYRELIESGLEDLLSFSTLRAASRLNRSMRYAVFPGGKRLRPVLALMGARIVNGSIDRAVPAACAVEMLHAASLIFDDLPAMDDADVRRGRPALHLEYGEDIALLTGLALLNQAYSIFGRKPALIRVAAECIGVDGMIGGQAVDLDIRTGGGTPAKFDSRNRKTTALMRLTLTAGAIACGANAEQVEALARCGECLGEAYQIYDDLLDQFGHCEETGKTVNQDSRHHRPSHVLEFGSSASRNHVCSLIAESKEALFSCFGDAEAVIVLTRHIDSIVGKVRSTGLVTA
jgi:geranylgeranyl diphosphate synthase, type II